MIDNILLVLLTISVLFVMFWWVTFPTFFLAAMVGYKAKPAAVIGWLLLINIGCFVGFLMSFHVYPANPSALLMAMIWLTPIYVLAGFGVGRLTLRVRMGFFSPKS